MTPKTALLLLIAGSALLRLGWASSVGAGNDEAYLYLFTVHPAWSYFDHPPMVAVITGAGLAVTGPLPTLIGLRLGFVVLFAGSTWLMARLGRRVAGPWGGFWAALALNVAAYHTAAAGAFALPDGPLLFFWLLTLDRLLAAAETPTSTARWLQVGVAWGLALLSKYHAVFLPAGMLLYLVVEPRARAILRMKGPYLATAVGLLCFAPVLAWNASNDWVSFTFQGERAVGGLRLRPDTLAAAIGGMALYLFPWMLVALMRSLIRGARGWAEASAAERLLLCQSIVPLVVFLGVACTRAVLPHWSLVAFLGIFPLVGARWAARSAVEPARMRRRAALLALMPIGIAAVVAAHARYGVFQEGSRLGLGVIPLRGDPTADLTGWDELAEALGDRGLLDLPGTFLFTSTWYQSGQLAFALDRRGGPGSVLCYNPGDSRGFAYWSRPEQWVGRDGILIVPRPRSTLPGIYERFFERIEPLEPVVLKRSGAVLRNVALYRCRTQIKPFPFQDGVEDRSAATKAEDPPEFAEVSAVR